MEFEITPKEMMALMEEDHKGRAVDALDQLIRYLRYTEKEYREKDGKHSGVEILNELLTQGVMKMDLCLNVREAVENYETPYEIILREGKKN